MGDNRKTNEAILDKVGKAYHKAKAKAQRIICPVCNKDLTEALKLLNCFPETHQRNQNRKIKTHSKPNICLRIPSFRIKKSENLRPKLPRKNRAHKTSQRK